jgi:hypothetical protein
VRVVLLGMYVYLAALRILKPVRRQQKEREKSLANSKALLNLASLLASMPIEERKVDNLKIIRKFIQYIPYST